MTEAQPAQNTLLFKIRANLAAIVRSRRNTVALQNALARLDAQMRAVEATADGRQRETADHVNQLLQRIERMDSLRIRSLSLLLGEVEGRLGAAESAATGHAQRIDLSQNLHMQAASELTRLDRTLSSSIRDQLTIKVNLAETIEAGRTLGTTLDAQARDLAGLEQSVEAQSDALAGLEDVVGAQAGSLADLERVVDVQAGNLAGLEQAVADAAEQLTGMDRGIAEQARLILQLDQNLSSQARLAAELSNAVERLGEADAEQSAALAALPARFAAVQADISRDRDSMLVALTRVDLIEAGLRDFVSKYEDLARRADGFDTALTRIDEYGSVSRAQIGQLQTSALQTAEEIGRLERHRSNHSAEIAAVKDGLAALGADTRKQAELIESISQHSSRLENVAAQSSLEATRLEKAINGQTTQAAEFDWQLKGASAKIATLEQLVESLSTRLEMSERLHVEASKELNRIELAATQAASQAAEAKIANVSASAILSTEDFFPVQPKDVARDREGRPRSVAFMHHSYYHFFYLAQALRKRGWDAWSVSVEDPQSPHALFYHGQDVSLWDADHTRFAGRIDRFNKLVEQRFKWLQFSGDGMMTVSPWKADGSHLRDREPVEFIRFRQAGVKIGYTLSGCNDGNAQTTWDRWTGNRCKLCRFRNVAEVCSDIRNISWANKRNMFCDLIASEQMPRLDYNVGPSVYSEPLTMALDENHWHPGINPPEKYRVDRSGDEVLVFHAVGSPHDVNTFGPRTQYKGTPAVVKAVDELRAEGIPIRLLFTDAVPSIDMRYLQVQADIIVDQLNFTRYGAFAREAMMLGKPVVGRIDRHEENGAPLQSLAECPVVSADVDTIKDVLRDLARDPVRRRKLGEQSRAYALKWHSATALAERFERVYDHVLAGGDPENAGHFGAEATHH